MRRGFGECEGHDIRSPTRPRRRRNHAAVIRRSEERLASFTPLLIHPAMLRQSRLFAKSLGATASRSRVVANSFSMRALPPIALPRFTAAALFSSKKLATPPPSSEDDDEAPEPLHSALAKELAEETAEDIDADADAELADVTKLIKKTFTITESLGKGVVHLHGTVGGTKVHVTFDCQDEAETGMDMDEFEMPPQGQGGDDEGEAALEFGINFTARLTSPDGAKMVLDAVAGQNLQILNVQHVPSGQDEGTARSCLISPTASFLLTQTADLFIPPPHSRGRRAVRRPRVRPAVGGPAGLHLRAPRGARHRRGPVLLHPGREPQQGAERVRALARGHAQPGRRRGRQEAAGQGQGKGVACCAGVGRSA